MFLTTLQSERNASVHDGGLGHPCGEVSLPEPAVEAEDEPVQVLAEPLSRDVVEGADQEALEVIDHQMHEGRRLVGLLGRLVRLLVGHQDDQDAEGMAANHQALAQPPAVCPGAALAPAGVLAANKGVVLLRQRGQLLDRLPTEHRALAALAAQSARTARSSSTAATPI